MKAILVPTDFSVISNNALDYAIELAKLTHAKIILFHAYYIPVVAAEALMATPDPHEMESYARETLESLEQIIHVRHGNAIQTECVCTCGLAVDEIHLFVKKHQTDLVVMGMHGAGYLEEKLIGSVTTSLIRKAACPVLAIDKHVRFKIPRRIVMACDHSHIRRSALWPLKDMAALFGSHVYILHVTKESVADMDLDTAIESLKLDDCFRQLDHSFHSVTNEEVVNGINDYVEKMHMDMVVMIPREKSFFEALFSGSNTRRMAFHTRVPLLALHN